MNTEMTKTVTGAVSKVVDEKTVRDFLFGTGTKLSTEQQNMFMQMAIRNNLDPFKKEIYVVAYGKEFNIITGYQVFIDRAERTGLLNGWQADVELDSNGSPFKATVTIYRKDWEKPFKWDALAKEFNKKQSTWNTMPGFMLKKVAIAQGFRMCFPSECGNLPYTAEEHEIINMGKAVVIEEKTLTNPLLEKINEALAGFDAIGVSKEQVEAFTGCEAENFTEANLASLREFYKECKADLKKKTTDLMPTGYFDTTTSLGVLFLQLDESTVGLCLDDGFNVPIKDAGEFKSTIDAIEWLENTSGFLKA